MGVKSLLKIALFSTQVKIFVVLLVMVLFCGIGYSLIADTTDVSVYSGWNLISPPYTNFTIVNSGVDSEPADAGSYYNDCNISVIYYYNTTTGRYTKISALENMTAGLGYWVYSKDNCTIEFSGYDYVNHDGTQLKKGWNMLGGTELFNINDYRGDCVFGKIAGYDGFEKNYSVTNSLQSGYGYWVYVKADCKLGEPKPLAYLFVADKNSLTENEKSFLEQMKTYSDPQFVSPDEL
ncbi:MAG: hypothetical protein V1870_01755 [Candidatus Aenigmatarchaeota archaeon]